MPCMKNRIYSILIYSICFLSCANQSEQINSGSFKIDTSQSFKINGTWATPKKTIKFDTLIKDNDSLHLVVCGEYVYSPFGILDDKSDFKKSALKNFKIAEKTAKDGDETFAVQSLNHNSSKVIFFFDHDPEASKHSSIVKGEINDRDVLFANGVHVGMSTGNFYNSFFDYFPDELKDKYKFFVLESCAEGIKHIYTFETGQLKSVKFITDYQFKVDY